MLKELLIAGLLGSVASVDTNLTTQYQNNTKYIELRCSVCESLKLPETHITYIEDSKNAYDFMNLFLEYYEINVIAPIENEFYTFNDSAEKEIKEITLLEFEHKFDELSHSLIKKIKHTRSVNRNISVKRSDHISFRITHDGMLTFGKIN